MQVATQGLPIARCTGNQLPENCLRHSFGNICGRGVVIDHVLFRAPRRVKSPGMFCGDMHRSVHVVVS